MIRGLKEAVKCAAKSFAKLEIDTIPSTRVRSALIVSIMMAITSVMTLMSASLRPVAVKAKSVSTSSEDTYVRIPVLTSKSLISDSNSEFELWIKSQPVISQRIHAPRKSVRRATSVRSRTISPCA